MKTDFKLIIYCGAWHVAPRQRCTRAVMRMINLFLIICYIHSTPCPVIYSNHHPLTPNGYICEYVCSSLQTPLTGKHRHECLYVCPCLTACMCTSMWVCFCTDGMGKYCFSNWLTNLLISLLFFLFLQYQ